MARTVTKQADSSDFDESEIERRTNQGSRFTTAGNEADEEDNVNFGLNPEEILAKLRSKPVEECCPSTPCRILNSRFEYVRSSEDGQSQREATAKDRLVYRPKSVLENLTDTISRPDGVVPPTALPDWHCLPLDKKIPRIPAPKGMLYYTPGKIAVKLHREPKVYSLADPYNRERVVGSPYTALHDPHARSFIKRPETRKHLYRQGLINENDEVMYSLKEFNKYRDYLKTLYRDDVQKTCQGSDDLWRAEKEQEKMVRKYISARDGKEAEREKKLQKARWIQKQARESQRKRLLRKHKETEDRLCAWRKERELINAERVVRGLEKARLQREKQRNLAETRRQQLIAICHESLVKQVQSFERRNLERQTLKQAQEKFLLEWLDAKINFSRERVNRTARVSAAWQTSLKHNAGKRQRRMEQRRASLPKQLQQRKERAEWSWNMVRKYFYIWLRKTRESMRAAHKDSNHESSFAKGATDALEQTVEYLRFQAGTEDRLDAFILNILRLKEEIKRQLALEEDLDDSDNVESNDEKLDAEVKSRISQYYGGEQNDAELVRLATELATSEIQTARQKSMAASSTSRQSRATQASKSNKSLNKSTSEIEEA